MRSILSVFVCITSLARNQSENALVAPLSDFIDVADSILLTENENSAAFREDANDHSRFIVRDGKVNGDIIIKQMWLASKDKSELRRIFIQPKKGLLGDGAPCFEPHHTIIFFVNDKCYPVEICFGCVGIRTPENILFSLHREFDKEVEGVGEFF